MKAVPFLSLVPRDDAAAVRDAIDRVVARGWFVLGPEVEAFEREFADAMGAPHAVGVGTGTDAIALVLRALGIGPGDEVITTPISAAYSALAIEMAGATPVFADVDAARLTLDPAQVEALITPRTRAILPVHLYGQPAHMAALERIASARGLALVEDCCQAHGACAGGRPVGTIGMAGAFSFYPTKNLGAMGDGGAVVTRDTSLAARIKRLRNGGQRDRYHHEEFGVNSRLDEIQAAVLRARLPLLAGWTAQRRRLAAAYDAALEGAPAAPLPRRDPGDVYHLYVVRSGSRDALQRHLAEQGIETLVHYPVPIPRQPAFANARGRCDAADRASGEILSLPLHPYLDAGEVERVVAAIRGFTKGH